MLSKMKNVVKGKKRLKIFCSLLTEGASFCNPIPSPEGEGSGKGWVSFKQSLVPLLPSLCSTKTQNIFQVITLFAFQIPHRNTPTIAVKSQPLSTFTHCEETCPLQVRYYPKKKRGSPAPQPIITLEEEAQLPHLELSQVSVVAQSQWVHRNPLRNTTSLLPCGAGAAWDTFTF